MKDLKSLKLLTGLLSILLITGFGMTVASASVDVPMKLSYQCNIAKAVAGGSALTNVSTMTFFLCSDSACNTTISTLRKTNVGVVNGIVSVVLGDSDLIGANPVSISNACQNATHLGLKINNGSLLQPVSELTTSMYAVRARYADSISEGVNLTNVTLPALPPNVIPGTAIMDNSITGSVKIAPKSITKEEIADNIFDSAKMTTHFVPDVDDNKVLTSDDQGIIFVEGQTTITLPDPTKNSGAKFTIKKTDDSIQRPCLGKPTCDILAQTSYVSIKAGLAAGEANKVTPIEGRTNEIHLFHKNSFVTLISDGNFWHIIGSNPPQDIFPPIPGNYGKVENDNEIQAGANVTLSWTRANDCDLRRCDICSSCPECADQQNLKYMVYYSKDAAKLTTLAAIREFGQECLPNWIEGSATEEMITATCYPADAAGDNYTKDFKLNIVVKDRYGNKGIYCSPGDNTPPEVASDRFYTSPYHGQGIISIRWSKADDTYDGSIEGDDESQLRYAIYYINADVDEAHAQDCLTNLNIAKLPTSCTFQPIVGPAVPINVQTDPTKIRQNPTNATECEVDIENVQAGTYYMTVFAVDRAGNTSQYQVQKVVLSN